MAQRRECWSSHQPVLRSVDRRRDCSDPKRIGIPAEKQKLIFEAFQRPTAHSRNMAYRPLPFDQPRDRAPPGRELQVRSKPGEGSTSPCSFRSRRQQSPHPESFAATAVGAAIRSAAAARARGHPTTATISAEPVRADCRGRVTFASILLDLAREAGLKRVSTAGQEPWRWHASFNPTITLDLGLDDINGFVCSTCSSTTPQPGHSGPRDQRRGEASDVTTWAAADITEKPVTTMALNDLLPIRAGANTSSASAAPRLVRTLYRAPQPGPRLAAPRFLSSRRHAATSTRHQAFWRVTRSKCFMPSADGEGITIPSRRLASISP